MPNIPIADLLKLNPRFFRSADLVRDFTDPQACSSYFVTQHAVRCLERITAGFKDQGCGRVWRVTGDYGSGKSSFALFLSRVASGGDLHHRFHRFYRGLPFIREKKRLLPVLVEGRRAAISEILILSIQASLKSVAPRITRGAMGKEIQDLIDACQDGRRSQNADQTLLALVPKLASVLKKDGEFEGLLFVIDEMGKPLEFAAQHPDRGDIFVLQQLGELAARSGSTPVVVIGLLHQGFESYVGRQGIATQREWDKVAGRFDQIIFDHPTDQVAGLVGMALGTDPARLTPGIRKEARARMEQAIDLGWYGSACGRHDLLALAPRIYPIDPMAFPAICRTFRRYGQNERSLFSFLYSAENHAIRAFSRASLKDEVFYGLPEFYNFVEANLSRNLAVHGYGSTWDLVASVVAGKAAEEPLPRMVLKSIGLLNLLGTTEIVPTEAAVCWAIAGDDLEARKQIAKSIGTLTKRDRVIFARGAAAGLCLWPHTSVDLQSLQERARGALPEVSNTGELIQKLLSHRPVVARRHYAETGTMRAFQIRYCRVEDLDKPVEISFAEADGAIFVPLVANETERRESLRLAREGEIKKCPFAVVAVPRPLASLQPYLLELMRWNWIVENTPELNGDRIAREEVSRQREAALLALQKQIDNHFGVTRPFGRLDLKIVYKGEDYPIASGRDFLRMLSDIVAKVFKQEPKVFNEMLNRRKPSSTAMMAWGKVVVGLFERPTIEAFGMDLEHRPPELALYMSIFQKSGVHSPDAGTWNVRLPEKGDDPCHLQPAFDFVHSQIPLGGVGRLRIIDLIASLQRPPYGIRTGLIHFILATYIARHREEIALFENGSFLREVGSKEMDRLIRVPERFEIQHVGVEGLRLDVFRQMVDVLSSVTEVPSKKSESVLAVVQPLCRFVVGLPQYVLNSNRLDKQTIAVRSVVMNAREPAKLLFADLPAAVGYPDALKQTTGNAKIANKVVEAIRASLIELNTAYDGLLGRIAVGVLDGLGYQGLEIDSVRPALAERASRALLYAGDFRIRAFCMRLQDSALDRFKWLEAMGSFVMSKTPKSWTDQDEIAYPWSLREIADQFQRVEALTYKNGHDPRHSLRIAITRPTGEEQMKVVHYTQEEEKQIDEIRSQFSRLLGSQPRLSIIAATKELWTAMETVSKKGNHE